MLVIYACGCQISAPPTICPNGVSPPTADFYELEGDFYLQGNQKNLLDSIKLCQAHGTNLPVFKTPRQKRALSFLTGKSKNRFSCNKM